MVTTQTTSRPAATLATPHRPGRVASVGRLAFGAMFTGGAAVHLVIVVTGTETYRHVADTAFIPFVKQAWVSVFMPHAALLGPLLAAFELAVGLLILAGARKTTVTMLVALLRLDFGNALGPRRNQRMGMMV
jgi:hypothetical protein